MSRILAICHPAGGTSGVFHDAPRAAGSVIDEWLPAERPEPPRPLGDYAALVVLGGDQNVCEQDRFPYLTAELALLREWLPGGRPVLGVCLGAQLLAEAAGGRVVRAERSASSAGSTSSASPRPRTTRSSASRPSASRRCSGTATRSSRRPARSMLARSPVCTQAFRLGDAPGACSSTRRSTGRSCDAWLGDLDRGVPPQARDAEVLEAGVAAHLEAWNAVRP